MSIIRGIRSVSQGYFRDFVPIPETEENMQSYVVLETTSDDALTYVELSGTYPESIQLLAKIIPHKNFPNTSVERIEDNFSLGKNAIYNSPEIYQNSNITNPNAFYSKLTLQFENSGEYLFHKKKHTFFKQTFDKYEIKFPSQNNVLFEKNFLFQENSVVEKMEKKKKGNTSNPTSENNLYRTYPYGGFYEYGAHPHEIESCIFQLHAGNSTSAIKIWKLSTFKSNLGFSATENRDMEGGMKFLGVNNFSENQKLSLYDELISGGCTFTVLDLLAQESTTYKSDGVLDIPKTNLIKINFSEDKTENKNKKRETNNK